MTAPDGARTLGAKVDRNAAVARTAAGRLLPKGEARALETKQVSINVGSDGKLLRTPQTWSGSLSECNLQGICGPIFSEKRCASNLGKYGILGQSLMEIFISVRTDWLVEQTCSNRTTLWSTMSHESDPLGTCRPWLCTALKHT